MTLSEILTEANMVGAGVLKREIPAELRHLPIIGRGSTSIVLGKDADSVIMLTRDDVKADWLIHSCGAVKRRVLKGSHASPDLNKMPIIELELPLFYPLSQDNARIVRRAIFDFRVLWIDMDDPDPKVWQEAVYRIASHFAGQEQHLLRPVADYVAKHRPAGVRFDMKLNNFMQDRDGNVVLVDPVYRRSIVDALFKHLYARA